MTRRWLALIALMLAGCATHPTGTVALSKASGRAAMASAHAGANPTQPGVYPYGARRTIPVVISLDVYQLAVPFGAVSRNEEFWQRVDEDRIDIGTHDLLLKNGIRIGLGRDSDWPYFKGLLGKYPNARSVRDRTQVGKEGYIELLMRSAIPDQVIFGLDDHNEHWGRRFEKCDDLLGISYVASTHNPGEATVKVCPIVRGLRRYFRVSIFNEETQFELTQPEHLYDMGVEAAIPMNDFLIVAPSKAAKMTTSMGYTFLMTEGNTTAVEHVLVIVPRLYRTDEPPGP